MKKQKQPNQPKRKERVYVSPSVNGKNIFATVNCHVVHGNGQRGLRSHKFVDTSFGPTSVTSAGANLSLINVTQGNTVSTRDGDVGRIERLYVNFSVDSANIDIFTRMRVIIFQWFPNTTIGSPTTTTLLETATLLSMYNFQYSHQYHIVKDFFFALSGLAGAPTASTAGVFGNEIDISSCKKFLEWTPTTAFGSNQLFVFYISDSALAPFPNLTFSSRVVFTDVTI